MPDLAEQLAFDFQVEMRKILMRYITASMQQAFDDTAEVLDIDAAFNVSNPRVAAAIERQVLKTAAGTAETLQDAIRSLLSEALTNGWSTDQLAAALREKATRWSRDKAETVAHTETAMAYETGNNEAWRASGLVVGKEWLLSFNACPQCQEYGGKVIGLDDEFADGIPHPPAHTRCRCATAPVVKS